MNFKQITLFAILLLSTLSFCQEKFTISGIISDKKNSETLIGVNVSVGSAKVFTSTNEYGFYSITLPKGEYELTISYIGYNTFSEIIALNQTIKKNISLSENGGQELQEVIVTNEKTKINTRSAEMSVNKLSISAIKKIPAVLGEVDLLKAILLLPGVTNAGEGASGFNVRGGGADQNLILLDEATIFNSSHLFGFFSVFNPDAVKDLKLYKGGIPARFGGRASSVLEIYQKDGNNKKFGMTGGIGLVSSRLLAEGPFIEKEKGSFLIGGRASYAHLFLKLSEEQKKNTAYFYDLNTKFTYKLNERNNLYLSGYFGRDVFGIGNSFVNTYGNSTFNLRWNHLFSDKLFSNLSLIYSDYYYGLNIDVVGFNWDSGIKNYSIKYDFKNYISEKLKLNFGINAIYYDFNPGTLSPSKESSGINYDQLDKKYAFEPSLYLDVEHKINDFTFAVGLRSSSFYRLGPSTINYYANNEPVTYNSDLKIYEKAVPTATKFFGKSDAVEKFYNLEPRFSMSYSFTNEKSIKFGYNRMVQYLQLISNTASPTPLDVWTPSDNYIQPQIADQVAGGYFVNFSDGKYSFEGETFYKKVKNRIDYIDGANLIANKAIEQVILNGEMRSYGLELLIRKNKGDFTGWISYTLSKSQQRTPGRNDNEIGINNGQWYNSGYDKLHNLAITASYKLSDKWSFGGNFILQSGQPVTYPNGQYTYLGINVPSFNQRNENRLPLFNHLDVSATLIPRKNKGKAYQSEWVFSVYNLYNRKNAASINFQQNDKTLQNEAVKTSIFGIVPSVTYNFKF